jgi:hypothetical protein
VTPPPSVSLVKPLKIHRSLKTVIVAFAAYKFSEFMYPNRGELEVGPTSGTLNKGRSISLHLVVFGEYWSVFELNHTFVVGK